MYFITAVTSHDADRRCFGFRSKQIDALNDIRKNTGNMHECLYDYLVMEHYQEGIQAISSSETWFKWTGKRWIRISKPESYRGIVNWAIG